MRTHPALTCVRCPDLVPGRRHVVWGAGQKPAAIMIIGEAPGANEDREGYPFVGRAGEHLDRLLAAAGIDRNSVYVTNAVKCRPVDGAGKNRRPRPREVENCELWLRLEMAQVRPRVVLLMGRTPAEIAFLHATSHPAGTARALTIAGQPVIAIATYHPAAALRNPDLDGQIVRDMRRARRYCEELYEPPPEEALPSGARPAPGPAQPPASPRQG